MSRAQGSAGATGARRDSRGGTSAPASCQHALDRAIWSVEKVRCILGTLSGVYTTERFVKTIEYRKCARLSTLLVFIFPTFRVSTFS